MSDHKRRERSARRRLSEGDVVALELLFTHAAPQFQRIASECLAFLGTGDDNLVVLDDVRERLQLKRTLVDWMERVCSARTPSSLNFDVPGWSPSSAMCALLLMQEELCRLADETLGPRAPEARRALTRALVIEADVLCVGLSREALAEPLPQSPPELATGTDRSAARTLAHDIRNPLNGAMLHATFLERELEDLNAAPELVEAVGTIKSEIRRVAELLDEFVDAPVPDARPRARVLVSTLCNRAIDLVARDAAAAGIEVGSDIAAEFGTSDLVLEVDMSKMLDVLSQLLQQAVEAALAGGGKVLLRARRESESAIIEVRHDQRALTTPVPILSSLLPAGANGESAAAHLGNLTVAVKVVAEHGGTIEVDSQPGRTEFRVKLPIGAVRERVAEQL